MTDSEIINMGKSIQDFLSNKGLDSAKPKDLMPWLIEKGFFKSDNRAGLPLREVLRKLDGEKKLNLLPNLVVERKEKNRYWSFVRLVS